ncbi:hypothetical protein JVU11DRAFT_3878 [Chiua virens]|nr:hypothetical protein JVU11DRAFT_3878 [Chiua virens]
MDANLATQVTEQILQEGSDIDQQGNDVMFEDSLSPFLTEEPVVNLPALVIAREDRGVVDMNPMVHAMLIEDVATRSPLPNTFADVPAVVINTNCPIEAVKEQRLTRGTGELLALDREESWNEEAGGMTSDIASPREHESWLASPSIEGPHPICSPIVDIQSPVGDVLETALPTSAPVSETGLLLAHIDLVVTDASPSGTRGVPRTNEIEAEVIYETHRFGALSDGEDFSRSLRNDPEGSETTHLETSAEIHATAVDSLVEPDADSGYVISGQSSDFSCPAVIEPTDASHPSGH